MTRKVYLIWLTALVTQITLFQKVPQSAETFILMQKVGCEFVDPELSSVQPDELAVKTCLEDQLATVEIATYLFN